MNICCIGDSLTEGDYGIFGTRCIANVHKENYPFFLAEYLGVKTFNYGKCGYTSTSYLDWYKQGNANVKNADVVIIMLGTNGGMSGTEETQGNKDYLDLIELIKADAPQAKIVLCTPPHCTENPYYSNCGYLPQVKEAVSFVRTMAKTRNLPLIDCFECKDFTAKTESVMQPNDGLHFGEVGYRHLAKYIGDNLKTLFPNLF